MLMQHVDYTREMYSAIVSTCTARPGLNYSSQTRFHSNNEGKFCSSVDCQYLGLGVVKRLSDQWYWSQTRLSMYSNRIWLD
jgi:hypothetical protein